MMFQLIYLWMILLVILVEDDDNYYVLMEDTVLLTLQGRSLSPQQLELGGDYSVQKIPKNKRQNWGDIGDLSSLNEINILEKINEDLLNEGFRTQEKINRVRGTFDRDEQGDGLL